MKKNKDNIRLLSENYRISALLEILIEYYMLTDSDTNVLSLEEMSLLNDALDLLGEGRSVGSMYERLNECRDVITEKMQVLTAYVDKFLVYMYVMNRVEYRYTMTSEERENKLRDISKEECLKDITSYMFGTEDNVVVNERIREVISQMPVRMARSRFFEHIKNSINLYSDSDCYSLDGYIYMLRTVTMLYSPKGIDKYFTEFSTLVEELKGIDFTDMGKDYYTIIEGKLAAATSKIQDISDIYMSLQKIINMLLIYCLNEDTEYNNKYSKYADLCYNAIKQIRSLFEDEYKEDAENIENIFVQTEGVMESLYEERVSLEAALCDCTEKDDKLYKAVNISGKLMSASLFAELDDRENEQVTKEYMNKVTDELLSDLQQLIKDSKRPVVRAVFALALGKLPVFFSNSREVMEYINDSLSQCNDTAELLATYNIIDELCWGD